MNIDLHLIIEEFIKKLIELDIRYVLYKKL